MRRCNQSSDQKVLGHIPTGWFPSKIEVSPDGKKLYVTNAKGYGSGPNGGKDFECGSGRIVYRIFDERYLTGC